MTAVQHQSERADTRRPTSDDQEIGVRLRSARRLRNVSIKELAALLGISFQQLHRYEAGTTRMSAGRLADAARHLDVDIVDLLAGRIKPLGPKEVVTYEPTAREIMELLSAFRDIDDAQSRARVIDLAQHLSQFVRKPSLPDTPDRNRFRRSNKAGADVGPEVEE
jgi:transcriptional regulator with XRE-family HTH domain